MNAIFKNKQAQQQFDAKGYAILRDVLDHCLLDALNDFWQENLRHTNKNNLNHPLGLYIHTKEEYVKTSLESYKQKLFLIIEDLLIDHKVVEQFFSFFNKRPNQGIFGLHKHPMLVDIRQHISITIWIPMVDVDENNGALWVIPNTFSDYLYNLDETNLKMRSELVPMKKGDVLVFNTLLHHWSDTNYSNKNRLAIGIAATPKNSKLITHYVRKENGIVIIDLYHSLMGGNIRPSMLVDKIPFDSFVYKQKDIPVPSKPQIENIFETESVLKTGQIYSLWRKLPASFRKSFFDIFRR